MEVRQQLPTSFIQSSLPTRAEYEASLLLPDHERLGLEARSRASRSNAETYVPVWTHTFLGTCLAEYTAEELELVLAAVQQPGAHRLFSNYHTSATLAPFTEHREVMMHACRHHGKVLQFAPPRLQADRELVATAVRNDWKALEFAAAECKADRELVLGTIRAAASAAASASRPQNNFWFLDQGQPSMCGLMLQHVPPELRADRELVTEAIALTIEALPFVPEPLRSEVVPSLPLEARRRILLNTASHGQRRPMVRVQVASAHVFEGTLAQIVALPAEEVRNGRLRVSFAGEIGSDAGGLSRDLFSA